MSLTRLAHRLSSLDPRSTKRLDRAPTRTGDGAAEKPDFGYGIAWAPHVGR